MKSTPRFLSRLLPFVAALGLLAAGCASQPKARSYGLRIELDPDDPDFASTSIQVDIIGANEVADLPKWQNYSVTSYWIPGDLMRRGAVKATLEFGLGKSPVLTFDSSDPLWNRWISTGALHLVILADLPGITGDQPGNADPRRLILPLDRRKWPRGVSTIDIRIQASGIKLLTPIKQR